MRVVGCFLLAVLCLVAGAARSDSESITLSREQIDQLELQMEEPMQKRERAAFKAGVDYQKQACPSLI